jgi:hypothetical protein
MGARRRKPSDREAALERMEQIAERLIGEFAAQSRRIANLDRLVKRMAQSEREAWLRRQLEGLEKGGA